MNNTHKLLLASEQTHSEFMEEMREIARKGELKFTIRHRLRIASIVCIWLILIIGIAWIDIK